MNFPSDSHEQTPETEPSAVNVTEAKREVSPAFRDFEAKLAALPTPEEKIAHGLGYMRSSISQEGTPRFREFWEARKQILPSFKDNINPAIRSKLWTEYVELTVEARRLKEILEEQSAFAMEQIDLAIGALEADQAQFEQLLAQTSDLSLGEHSTTIQAKSAAYNQIQRELNLLNTLASRLNALRKEVVKTDMRIRFKTKFFKRLSELGDTIFPKRKQLIEQISQEFERDVEQFISSHFQGEQVVGAPYYALREEIKSLQGMAKIFTLSSGVFNRTRLKLSECWDKIKVLEKEHKKEVVAKKAASSENRTALETKIQELGARSAEMGISELDQAIDEVLTQMRQTELHRDDVRFLRDELSKLRAPHLKAQEEKAKALEEAEREKLRIKREKIAFVKEKISQLLREGSQMELELFLQSVEETQAEVKALEASKIDQQQLDRSMRQLRDLAADRKESSLLNLSEDDVKALETLKSVLQQKKQRRQEIKDQLESYRRQLGSSNLDFEKAMLFRELVDQEKERLEKANAAIEEIENKIEAVEG